MPLTSRPDGDPTRYSATFYSLHCGMIVDSRLLSVKVGHASVAPERRSKRRARFVDSPSDRTLPRSTLEQVANAVLRSVLGR
jgi:hypothetical protein